MTDFAWLIEAPGAQYLETITIGHYPAFRWTNDHDKALRFISKDQADGVMMAVRRMEPALFAFESTLGNAWPREHGWLALATPPDPPGLSEEEVRIMSNAFWINPKPTTGDEAMRNAYAALIAYRGKG